MLFSYEAKDYSGRTVTGSLEAIDERTAAGLVQEQGYVVMRLSAQSPPSTGASPAYATAGTATATLAHPGGTIWQAERSTFDPLKPPRMTVGRWIMEHMVLQIWSGVSSRDLAIFYRQFATLMDAGVPLKQSFDAMTAQSANPVLSRCMQRIWLVIEAGGSLSDGMALFPWIFRESQRALVVAGELTGSLDLMCRRIATFLEQDYAFRTNIKKSLTEPLITFAGVFLLPPLFLLVVRNDPHAYYQEAILPLLQICGTLLGIFVLGKVISQIRYIADLLIACTPVVGPVVRIVALAKFCRTMATLYAAGVSVPTTVRYASDACGNAWLAARMSSTVGMMESGYGLVDSLIRTRVLPPMVISMLGVGEATGAIDVLMDKVAEHFEQEALLKFHRITVAVRVLATILIGIRVLLELIQFYVHNYGDVLKSIDSYGN